MGRSRWGCSEGHLCIFPRNMEPRASCLWEGPGLLMGKVEEMPELWVLHVVFATL